MPQPASAQQANEPTTSERIELATDQAKQKDKAAAEATVVSLRDILKKGGFMMYPLAALSFVAVLLIIFYTLTIRQNAVVSDHFMDEAESMIRKQDYLGLIAYCNRSNQAVARVTQKTLDFATRNPKARFTEVRELAEAEGSRQASLMGQRISYLMDVGSVAPMVGLLGTVLGMIKSFNEIGSSTFAGAKQVELAGGVSEALITTASGLVIGIPALIFYSIFKGRVAKFISELEAASTHIVALLAVQYSDARERAAEWAPEARGAGIRSTATRRSRRDDEFPQDPHDEPRGI
ncbi:MotA/TolQ/ExbB proton channel family protein [Sulfuriroseicoccus oceanibius]|uniref:MotA/TolQ/ExbB proton channel family protein n=2 Tax=Sulfuriroseicoccus oceanibius TaxID=2707525 RepID=A0A6B3L586_9BACT|nr:MotA/TolQ/ExbB proton channel family protein [Sulfuriroseicoccus oceanibius]